MLTPQDFPSAVDLSRIAPHRFIVVVDADTIWCPAAPPSMTVACSRPSWL
ncbi:hypothetical protein ACQ86B_29165 (plasmid) [Mycolicibacterium aichiense]